MPQSLFEIIIHIIFSTKNREPLIPSGLLSNLHAYISTTCRENQSKAYRVGGTENHMHIACTLPRIITVSDIVQKIKTHSAKWIKTQKNVSQTFAWQAGYAAFSISKSHLDILIEYIDKQKEHHKHKTFQEEYLEFLKKYEIEYDERYVWS